jgi:uncharacterized protein YqeY
MTIAELRNELKQSMLQKDTEKTGVIRMILSAISYSAMSKNKKEDELTEGEIDDILLKELKSRQETIQEFEKVGAIERAAKERSELEVLKVFAPKLMNEDETRHAVKDILEKKGGNLQFGPAMGVVMAELKGKADGGLIQKVLKELIG